LPFTTQLYGATTTINNRLLVTGEHIQR